MSHSSSRCHGAAAGTSSRRPTRRRSSSTSRRSRGSSCSAGACGRAPRPRARGRAGLRVARLSVHRLRPPVELQRLAGGRAARLGARLFAPPVGRGPCSRSPSTKFAPLPLAPLSWPATGLAGAEHEGPTGPLPRLRPIAALLGRPSPCDRPDGRSRRSTRGWAPSTTAPSEPDRPHLAVQHLGPGPPSRGFRWRSRRSPRTRSWSRSSRAAARWPGSRRSRRR